MFHVSWPRQPAAERTLPSSNPSADCGSADSGLLSPLSVLCQSFARPAADCSSADSDIPKSWRADPRRDLQLRCGQMDLLPPGVCGHAPFADRKTEAAVDMSPSAVYSCI